MAQLAVVGSLLSRAVSAENATLSGKALRMDSEEVLLSAEESGWFVGTASDLKARSWWELLVDGEGIHWPDADEDLSVEGLLAGNRAKGAG